MEKPFFYSYEQMQMDIKELKACFPGACQIAEHAVSADGRAVVELALGSPAAKKHVLIHGGMHGREYLNCALLVRLAEDYLKKQMVSPDICFHILPMVNPDGCTISQKGVSEIRSEKLRTFLQSCYMKFLKEAKEQGEIPETQQEYFAGWKANARGVDLNRNFPFGWGTCSEAFEPQSQGYRGKKPFSEKESQVILRLYKKYPLDCCVSYHSSGNLVYWDYGSEGSVLEADKKLAQEVGDMTGYAICSSVKSKTALAGCSDYFVRECKIPAVTIETGRSPCPLPEKEFAQIYRENQELLSLLCRWMRQKK